MLQAWCTTQVQCAFSHNHPLVAMLLRDRHLWQRGSSLQLQRLPFQVCLTKVKVLYGLEITSFAKAKGWAVDEEFHMPRPSSLAIQALDDQSTEFDSWAHGFAVRHQSCQPHRSPPTVNLNFSHPD